MAKKRGQMNLWKSILSLVMRLSEYLELLSMRRRWVSRFATLLGCQFSTLWERRKRVGFVLFMFLPICLLVLGRNVPVLAQGNDSTPTFRPLFPTVTPQPTNDYSCSGQLPPGWGTITPEPWWSINCQGCINTAVANVTPSPTIDPTQPTPTLTPTSNPEKYFICVDSPGFTCPIDHEYPDYRNGIYINDVPAGWGTTIIDLEFRYHHIQGVVGETIYIRTENEAELIWDTGGGVPGHIRDVHASVYMYHEGTEAYLGDVDCGTGASGSCIIPEMEYEWITNSPNNGDNGAGEMFKVGVRVTGLYTGGGGYADMIDLHLFFANASVNPFGDPTPEPTPLSGYCDDVNNGLPVDPDPIDIMPIPVVGVGTCLNIGPFTAETLPTWLIGDFANDINMPGISVCLAPVEFGNIHFMGMTINLDVMAFAASAAVIIRLLVRS